MGLPLKCQSWQTFAAMNLLAPPRRFDPDYPELIDRPAWTKPHCARNCKFWSAPTGGSAPKT